MKLKIYLYRFIRISLGILLMFYSVYNAIKYPVFLDRLDVYFNYVSIFDLNFIEALAPLVPFEEFVLGFFLILGMFTRKALIASIVLFTFFTLFLIDANHYSFAFIYFLICLISIVLLRKNNYDINTGYKNDFHQVIQ